ncbi:uncharacterized protein LOC128735119 [Sabethes cyaneus]|uniref:uncharacterized protein LOC128735119 n=1 Tax=Sabethes cyaneus TaxID=53552 RepID=UPI00237EC60F|nr:uncharacterized protein LOC128735119 [Sabethes cyaneus]
MTANRIFLVELIVDELQMFPREKEADAELAAESPLATSSEVQVQEDRTECPERCVRFQLANLARCEVCEKDFGSRLDLEHPSKLGESCMFVLSEKALADDELEFEISALEKQEDGGKIVLGKWKQPANEIFSKLVKSYNEINGKQSSETSIHSARSENSIAKKTIPVSETIKSLYPLHSDNGEDVQGCVVVTLRISCLGSRITQKVMFGAKTEEPGVTCFKSTDADEQERYMKCVAFDDLAHPHPVLCKECDNRSIPSQPPTPAVSVTSKESVCAPYDEYTAEMNGNAISIRVEKNSDIKVMLGDEQDGKCVKGCWTSLTLPEGVYALQERYVERQKNPCRLPVVRGNLKYPAQQWSGDFLVCKQKRPICAEDFRKRPDPTRSICMQTRDPESTEDPAAANGIEICRKGWHDPNVDVFVLKLGKNKTTHGDGSPNQIELELRTPKGPMVEKRPKETRGVQVIEAEFDDVKKPPVKEAPKKAKKPAKKGKKK